MKNDDFENRGLRPYLSAAWALHGAAGRDKAPTWPPKR